MQYVNVTLIIIFCFVSGKRFGLLQTKVGLTMLLKHFRFFLNEKTKVPIEIEPFSFTLLPKSVFLDVEEVIETN